MIYFVEAVGLGHVKIGFVGGEDVSGRLAELQVGSPVPLRLLGTMPGDMAVEKDLHRQFASSRVHGEWFRPTPELMALVGKDLPACGSHAVVTQSVQIKVLTVGRKQFTKALLDQLPRGCPFDFEGLWDQIFSILGDFPHAEVAAQTVIEVRDDSIVWGWTQGGTTKSATTGYPLGFKRILFERNGVLGQFHCYHACPIQLPPGRPHDNSLPALIQNVWDTHRTEWLSEKNHLYTGV